MRRLTGGHCYLTVEVDFGAYEMQRCGTFLCQTLRSNNFVCLVGKEQISLFSTHKKLDILVLHMEQCNAVIELCHRKVY